MLFRLSEVHKSYGTQDLLRGASLQINPGEHVGLVGRNGAGKTTVFRLVSGDETPDRGDVVRARGLRLGLLAQHVHFESGSTVHESALTAFGHLQHIEHEMHDLEHRMAETDVDLERVLERYSDLQHQCEREGGFEYAAKAEIILQGLGFDRACQRIVELDNGRASSYSGNYSDYLVERAVRREAQQRAYDNQQQLIAKTEDFIRRNLVGQKTKQ